MAADPVIKRRGRPRQFDGPAVSVRLPQVLYDELSLAAIRQHTELSRVIRQRLDGNFVSQNSTKGERSAQS
jgi:hypothetical protein